MKGLSKLLIIGVTLLGLVGSAYAWNPTDRPGFPRRGPGFGCCLMDPRTMLDLKLTPEQETKINALQLQYLKEIKPLQEKMFSLNGDLRLLWLVREPNESKILALQKELRNIRDQIIDKKIAYHLKIRSLLTPEQQQRFAAYPWVMGPGMGMGGFGRGHGRMLAPMMECGPYGE